MISWEEAKVFFVIAALLLIPGLALLAVTGIGQRWRPLQRWIVATGLGIAFYPLLFYGTRWILPGLQITNLKLLVLLAVLFIFTAWKLRKNWKGLFAFDTSEWIAIGLFGAILFTRLWVAHFHPFPAWSDSLHHTLLTQLTAVNGRLPLTLEPYESVPLTMYHLGLYALTGSTQMISLARASTSLLWMVQVLNGLCGLGVYLVLDAKVGRKAALVGTVVVGLLSFQPAWYVNWGRDTQVASQAILLIAWWVTWEALRAWAAPGPRKPLELAGLTLAGAMLTAAVFLLHFRVAAFYLPLVFFSAAWELYRGYRNKTFKAALLGVGIAGLLSILFVLPALIGALGAYIQSTTQVRSAATLAQSDYFSLSTNGFFEIALRPWLFFLAAACGIFLLLRRSKPGILVLAWVLILWFEGNAYQLNIRILAFTNYSGIVIMHYLPAALLIGMAAEEIFHMIPALQSLAFQRASLVVLLLFGLAGSGQRITETESYRYFLTPADVTAMAWIVQNTPPDAMFGINSYLWEGASPQGTDGGYWIPYYTGRKTTTGSMLNGLGSKEYLSSLKTVSQKLEKFSGEPGSIQDLCDSGVDYVYIGVMKGNFSGPGLLAANFATAAKVYDLDGVQIFKICP